MSSAKPSSVLDSDQESNVEEETSTEASLGGDGTSTVNEVCILALAVCYGVSEITHVAFRCHMLLL